MAQVTGIVCSIFTQGVENADTEGSVFLGLGGREFRLDSKLDDFERGMHTIYILGLAPTEPNLLPGQVRVNNPNGNDPAQDFLVDTDSLDALPKYIRQEGDDHWNVCLASAKVYSNGQFIVSYSTPDGFFRFWLGPKYGRVLHLTNVHRNERLAQNFIDAQNLENRHA